MKRFRPVIIAACLFAACLFVPGCAGTLDTTDKRCNAASAVYEAYLASTLVRQPSKDETAAANAAAIVLRLYCGYTPARPGEVQPALAPAPNLGKGMRAAPVQRYLTNEVGEIELSTGVPMLMPPGYVRPAPTARARSAPPRPAKVPANDPDHLHVTLSDGSSVAVVSE